VLLALTVIEPDRLFWLVIGAVVMGPAIAINHWPGRYAVQ
jgi:hypothetical protein